MPKVSFIVPVYKVEAYIRQCVDSILSQTLKDIEVILVDDGSPDGCPAICDEYAALDPRVTVLHKPNGGVSDARNHGIERASGEWLYFVDSDDWIEEDAAEKLYEDAVRMKVDCVISDGVIHYTNGRTARMRMYSRRFRTREREKIEMVQKSILCHRMSDYFSEGADLEYPTPWTKFVKRSIVMDNNIRFDPYVMGLYDDGLFCLYLLEHVTSLYYCGRHTYNYRIVSGSLVHAYKENMMVPRIRGCERVDQFIEECGKDDSFRQAEYCRRVSYFAGILTSNFFSPSNRKKYPEIRKEIKAYLSDYPYKEAFAEAKASNLDPKHRYILYCGKTGLIEGMAMYSMMKQKLKKWSL